MSQELDNAIPWVDAEAATKAKTYLLLTFPAQKAQIARLSHEEKMEWYAHQFELRPYDAAVMGTTPEFQKFWKWRVLMPIKCLRFWHRLKNFQMFKRYEHISDMRKKAKPQKI